MFSPEQPRGHRDPAPGRSCGLRTPMLEQVLFVRKGIGFTHRAAFRGLCCPEWSLPPPHAPALVAGRFTCPLSWTEAVWAQSRGHAECRLSRLGKPRPR